jgi:hypothetical protein
MLDIIHHVATTSERLQNIQGSKDGPSGKYNDPKSSLLGSTSRLVPRPTGAYHQGVTSHIPSLDTSVYKIHLQIFNDFFLTLIAITILISNRGHSLSPRMDFSNY